jgi:ABC-2 type transport system permease protein
MQVFKAYFKIMRSHKISILIYFSLFLFIAVLVSSAVGGGAAAFAETKSNVAVVNMDKGAALSDGLEAYIRENANVVAVSSDGQGVQDALFSGNVSYVLRIPAGFARSFLGGSAAESLQRTAASGTTSGVYMDFLVNRYLNMASLYAKNAPGMDAAEIVKGVNTDLANRADVVMKATGNEADTNDLSYYFRYLAYSIMAVMIIGVTTFMMSFNGADLNGRNQCSPMRPLAMNLQIVLGNALFAVSIWAALCAAAFLFYGRAPLTAGTALLCLNALALTAASLSIGFLAGKFIRNHGVQSAVTNVVSLGTCFLSGVFVEQELLGRTVLNIARFTPGYWYVKALDDIRGMAEYSFRNMLPALYAMLIQLGFAAAIFILAMVLAKKIKPQREI